MPQELRDARAAAFPEGCRVVARRFAPSKVIDDNVTVPPGTEGTVAGPPDDFGSVPVHWDNGAGIAFLVNDEVERV